MSNEETLRKYILENYLFTEDESELDNNNSFLELGIIDSTGIMEVVLFIEMEFDIEVDDEELLPENLDTINNLVKFIATRQAAKSG
ncbi:acyl carrier protein [Draconibacterium sp.]|nr:acyl carrier protein [Draconibacterium sp.]